MYTHRNKYLKHLDFIVSDLVILEISYMLACLVYDLSKGASFTTNSNLYRHQLILLSVCFLTSNLFFDPYKNVLKRDKWMEVKASFFHTARMAVLEIILMFFIHETDAVSRLTFAYTWGIYFIFETAFRLFWKRMLRHHILHGRKEAKDAVLLVTSRAHVDKVLKALNVQQYGSFFIDGIFYTDYEPDDQENKLNGKTEVIGGVDGIRDYAMHHWVDGVILDVPRHADYEALAKHFEKMGIAVHRVLLILPEKQENGYGYVKVQKFGKVVVASNLLREVSTLQLFWKRALDIIGGIVGCILTGIIFIFIAPKIYHASPGPIFFGQERIGKNGRHFKMYKFRSMYLDAEERKKDLMKKNKMNGLMFKMDDDPRIIGSEKKDKNGKPKGIGNFIRRTSLDEFPQFFNVLKGDMSLVGTRPPTLDEWNRYSEEHRIRMVMRPGITGMWQVSGRSSITDFDEVVRLDEEYIENWTVGMDIKILFKTIGQVLKHEGAE